MGELRKRLLEGMPLTLRRSLKIASVAMSPGRLSARARLRLLLSMPRCWKKGVHRGEVKIPVSGGAVFLDEQDFFVDVLTLSYLWNERVFEANCRDRLVLDLGAHKGFYAARALAGGAKYVVSVEPEQRNFELLARARGSSTRSANWDVRRVAVGSDRGIVSLYVSSESWAHSVTGDMIDAVGTQRVEMVTLSDLLSDLPVHLENDEIVLKANVEGGVGQILLSTSPAQMAQVVEIDLDIEPGSPFDMRELDRHLRTAGFSKVAVLGGKLFKYSKMRT